MGFKCRRVSLRAAIAASLGNTADGTRRLLGPKPAMSSAKARGTTALAAVATFAAALLVFAGCGGNSESSSSGSSGQACPVCSANTSDNSFGPFVFNGAGDDSTARRFVNQCGFAVSGGHNGGSGDTLQVRGCAGGVELVWAFNQFSAYRVSAGWTGQTDRGVMIGQTRAQVVARDPRLGSSSGQFQVTYGPGDILQELIVGQFFRR